MERLFLGRSIIFGETTTFIAHCFNAEKHLDLF